MEITGAYAYAMNNPQRFVDPGGTDPTSASEDTAEDGQTKADFEAVVTQTAEGVPKMVTNTNAAAQRIATGKGAAFISPDPDARTEAA